ncbi:uncharacterized protein LOC135399899 [Ornithodoros turicata]|uniref:uncharacterized protein LOC135399899 n=1 Tax=Ornithodoros turicata TaxID=34597 RepID=UPI00313892B1
MVMSEMATSSSSACRSCDADLLHPELMTSQTILDLLKAKYVKHPRLEELDKPSLVELYHNTILPLPQREYKKSRLGECLSKKAALFETRKRKSEADSNTIAKQAAKRSKSSDAMPPSRLKPPPTKVNPGKTRTVLCHNSGCESDDKEPLQNSQETAKPRKSKSSESESTVSPSKKKHRPITWP